MDTSDQLLNANNQFFTLFNIPAEGNESKNIVSILRSNPDTGRIIDSLKEKTSQAFINGKPIAFRPDDEINDIELSIIPACSSAGDVTSVCIVMHHVPKQTNSGKKIDAMLHKVFDLVPEPSFIIEPDGLVTTWNEQSRETIFGLSEESMPGTNLFSAVHHDDASALRERVSMILGHDSAQILETRFLHQARNEYLWQSVTARRIMIDGKHLLLAVAKDINCYKQIEHSLTESENKFRKLFDGHSTIMMLIDADTRKIIDANQAAAAFYGWPVEKLCNMLIDEITTTLPDVLLQEIELIRKSKQSMFSVRHRKADGSISDVDISTNLIDIAGSDVFYCIITDVTERKRIEKELQISRSQLDFALQKSHIGWWNMNARDGTAIRTLEHAKIFGYDSTLSEWSYKQFLDHVIPEDRDTIDAIVRKSINKQQDWHVECRIRRTDGEERWIMVIGGLQHDDAGDVLCISGIIMDITERKKAEIEIKETREKFDLALKAARAGVWEMDIVHNKAVWSNEIEHLLGIEQQGPHPSFDLWMKAIHPDDRETVMHIISQTTWKAMESNMEFRVCWPDGSIHWLMSRGQPVYNDNGKWTGYLGTIIDITERRELLESVRQSEADYRSLFNNIPNGFAYCQMINDGESFCDFVFLNINERFETLTRLSNVIGKRVTAVIPGIRQSDEALFRHFESIAQNGKHEHFEYYLEALGEWFSVSAYCTKDNYFTILFDVITQRKETEKSLRESEHKFRTITEQISEIVFVTEFSGNVRYISPSIEKIAGYRQADVVGHNFLEFLTEDEIPRAQEKFMNAISNHLHSEVFELKYKKKDGSDLYGEIGVRYYHEESDKNFSGLIGVIRDITQRKNDEALKKQLEQQLHKAERLETIGRLAGSIAHEFNNLLTPILGYAELGMINAAEEEPYPEYFTAIMQAAERAKHLISQILTFSKEGESTPAVIKVQSIINEALKLLRPSIPASITIEQSLDKTCRNVLIDPTKLHQVIVNLCTNAYQAIGKTGGIITIDLRETIPDLDLLKKLPRLKAKSYMQLSVSDTGTGMDNATLEHIFEPFFTTKPIDKGSGLGLSVVHGIITGYDGDITVESNPGKGTTFRVFLPVINQEVEHSVSDQVSSTGKGHILFVDDEQVILDMVTKMLTKIGFDICAMKKPTDAIEIIRQNPDQFDLLITDLTMPEMNGLELATEVHNNNPGLPIILMTGYGKDIENTISMNEHGICQILKKPVRLAELVSTVNAAITSN
ncbi:MAG: PAS domain S-box protein [Chlorobiaceae bacterium]|nr:PAS domain S-box protein [Chlorobiaceae bacterium]